MNDDTYSFRKLHQVFEDSPEIPLRQDDRYVIFSDLHMGNGSWTDDFAANSEMFAAVLDRYYLFRSFSLILNGDVEELQRFSLAEIHRRWAQVYAVLTGFTTSGASAGLSAITTTRCCTTESARTA